MLLNNTNSSNSQSKLTTRNDSSESSLIVDDRPSSNVNGHDHDLMVQTTSPTMTTESTASSTIGNRTNVGSTTFKPSSPDGFPSIPTLKDFVRGKDSNASRAFSIVAHEPQAGQRGRNNNAPLQGRPAAPGGSGGGETPKLVGSPDLAIDDTSQSRKDQKLYNQPREALNLQSGGCPTGMFSPTFILKEYVLVEGRTYILQLFVSHKGSFICHILYYIDINNMCHFLSLY